MASLDLSKFGRFTDWVEIESVCQSKIGCQARRKCLRLFIKEVYDWFRINRCDYYDVVVLVIMGDDDCDDDDDDDN